MKYLMHGMGVEARVIPNGIDDSWFDAADPGPERALKAALAGRTAVTKVARWDREKRWDYAVDAVAMLKSAGMSPVFFARGGSPDRGGEVLDRMRALGLSVARVRCEPSSVRSLASALVPAAGADVVLIESMLDEEQCKLLYRASSAVLANSSVEPFGLVGLEAMASGGIAAVGATGEDYVTSGYDAISLQTDDVREFAGHLDRFKRQPELQRAMRAEARRSAARFTWTAVIERALTPFLLQLGIDADARLSRSGETPGAASGYATDMSRAGWRNGGPPPETRGADTQLKKAA
jgi:glycosyltransferase involved in cell wall biosynthesis